MIDLEKSFAETERAYIDLVEQKQREKAFSVSSQHTFNANMQAFEKYYPDLAISLKTYKPKPGFKLLVTKTGVGNFVPDGQSVPLYADDPIVQVTEQVSKNTKKGYYSYTSYGFGGHTTDKRIHMQFMTKLDNLIASLNNQKPQFIEQLPSHFPSSIIFGVGLGYHIPILLNNHHFDYLFICEPDIELFYASLFCTDWAEIIQNVESNDGALFIQVGLSYKDFFDSLHGIAGDIGAFSLVRSFCYQHYPSKDVNQLIKSFFERYFELQSGFGFYNDNIDGLAHAIHNIQNGVSFFVANSQLKKTYQKLPLIIVGNGPSLDASVELLQKMQHNAIILAVGSALASLLKVGVTPDFHVIVERTLSTYDVLLETLPLEAYKNINLLTVDVMYPEIPALYKWAGMGLKGPESASVFIQLQTLKKFHQALPSLPSCGPVVSNTALSYAAMMGFEEIYLVGVDNGSRKNVTHSKHSFYYNKGSKYQSPLVAGAKHVLPGNLGEDVLATDLLMISKNHLEAIIAANPKKFFYNVGHGAKLEGAYAVTEQEVLIGKPIENKQQVIEQIKADFFVKDLVQFDVSSLDFDQFDIICDDLIEIGSRPFTSRESAADLLKKQARYLFSYKKTKYSHLYYLLRGSLLYVHCPMLTMLYSYQDDELTLEYFGMFMALWNDYVLAIKKDYRVNYLTKCGYTLAQAISELETSAKL